MSINPKKNYSSGQKLAPLQTGRKKESPPKDGTTQIATGRNGMLAPTPHRFSPCDITEVPKTPTRHQQRPNMMQ